MHRRSTVTVHRGCQAPKQKCFQLSLSINCL